MTYALIQANGERIPVEEWLLRAFENGTCTDPALLRFWYNRVEVRPFGWPR